MLFVTPIPLSLGPRVACNARSVLAVKGMLQIMAWARPLLLADDRDLGCFGRLAPHHSRCLGSWVVLARASVPWFHPPAVGRPRKSHPSNMSAPQVKEVWQLEEL